MRTKCYDPDEQEWEWENMYENDGTLDGSLLTSIHTDGRAGTSASNNNHGLHVEDSVESGSADTSVKLSTKTRKTSQFTRTTSRD